MKEIEKKYDLVVIGTGAAGMIAAITAARSGKSVLVLEKLSKIGAKLKATGGGKCNLTNTLDSDIFMSHFGKNGKFMGPALEAFDHEKLISFFDELGMKCHAPDGKRVFPVTHSSSTVIDAMHRELQEYPIDIHCSEPVKALKHHEGRITAVVSSSTTYLCKNVVVATGGKGYPVLGAEGDGYLMAQSTGHTVTEVYPAMMPLKTKETWVENCRSDTIAKVSMHVDMKKYKKLKAKGDLIFTKSGIRGPVVLDFSREITPLLAKYSEVPLLANFTKGMNEEEIREHFKKELTLNPHQNLLALLCTLLPEALSLEFTKLSETDPKLSLAKQKGTNRDKLICLLAWTPLTITGHDGFKLAMITRGGVSLKDIDPNTMESKKINGLYFCGEVVDLDGPCGGYNLQWSFSSGYLAGASLS